MAEGARDSDAVEAFNEDVREDWIEDTTGFERVQSVIRQTTEPKSASEIAELVDIAPKTARKYLNRLTDLHVAEKIETSNGSLFRQNKEWLVSKEISRIRAENSKREIQDGIRRMKEDIHEYREEYDVDSPEELLLQLEPDDARDAWMDQADWQTTERNLALAQAALQFDEAVAKSSIDEAPDDGSSEDDLIEA